MTIGCQGGEQGGAQAAGHKALCVGNEQCSSKADEQIYKSRKKENKGAREPTCVIGKARTAITNKAYAIPANM